MPLKNLVCELKEMKEGMGSISRRNFDIKFLLHRRARSQSGSYSKLYAGDDQPVTQLEEGQERLNNQHESCWASLPPELLSDVLKRVEAGENTWPARQHVVACAAVCRAWREVMKELVKTPEECGNLTFPVSLKQPGPRDGTMQCFIKRDRATCTYHLYLGLTPSMLVENGKFLIAARKFRRATSTDYIISLNADDFSRGSSSYLGKLRSNFIGTKFTIYDNQSVCDNAVAATNLAAQHIRKRQVSSKFSTSTYGVAHVAYELNVLGMRGPRRMQCLLHSIPASAIEARGNAPTPDETWGCLSDSFSYVSSFKQVGTVSDSITAEINPNKQEGNVGPLMLRNKAPRWHEQLQCWCLNFRGRVTVASVKNFQLVPASEPSPSAPQSDHDKVLLQSGKVGKDIFTMDYRYPLSAFHAFAICLSSFDSKLACE